MTAALLYDLNPPPLSDRHLIRHFKRNEAAFNELRDAVRGEGGLESLPLLRTKPIGLQEIGVSVSQVEAYHVKLRQLRLVSVSERYNSPEDVLLQPEQRSAYLHKSYVYLQTPPAATQIVKRTTAKKLEALGELYRPLGRGWYLYAYNVDD